jgi:hypothetical protein
MDGALQAGGPRPLRGLFLIRTEDAVMRKAAESEKESEPVGIVISRGSRDEPTPAFFAYIWGPAPEAEEETTRVIAPRAA